MRCVICKEEFEQPKDDKSNVCRTCAQILYDDFMASQAAEAQDMVEETLMEEY